MRRTQGQIPLTTLGTWTTVLAPQNDSGISNTGRVGRWTRWTLDAWCPQFESGFCKQKWSRVYRNNLLSVPFTTREDRGVLERPTSNIGVRHQATSLGGVGPSLQPPAPSSTHHP